MDSEAIMLSEISQRKTNTVSCHLYVNSKDKTEKQNRLVVARAGMKDGGNGSQWLKGAKFHLIR